MIPITSIIVPCYNQALYLEEALQSVMNQTYQDWECIIINDGSSDCTEKISQKWIVEDARYSYLIQENKGLSSARNLGIASARGKYVLALDADDYISKDYIEKVIHEFEKDITLKIVYAKAFKFGAVKCKWKLPEYDYKNLLNSNMIYCSAVFKKSDWELVGGYDFNLIYGNEDWELWISILKNGGNVKRLDFVGFYYRVKESSMITNLNGIKAEFSKNYISTKHAEIYAKEFGKINFIKNQLKGKRYYVTNKKFIVDLILATYFGVTIFIKIKK
jgi:glycosyltransferase involved in cell wall biosynthesis